MSDAPPEDSDPFAHGTPVIDPARYYDDATLSLEQERLWPRVWLLAGWAADLQRPGDHLVFDLGKESILLSCDGEGQIRAFHNVCLHRGARLRDCAGRSQEGFACPYHGWRWGLDGALAQVPDGTRLPQPLDASRRQLSPVHCQLFAGMVWVHMDEPQQSLAEYLGEVGPLLQAYQLEQFVLTGDFSSPGDWNWKLGLDASAESYHVSATHPQLLNAVDPTLCQLDYFGLHSRLRVPMGLLGEGASPDARTEPMLLEQLKELGEDITPLAGKPGTELRPLVQAAVRRRAEQAGADMSRLDDAQMTDTNQFLIFPNVFIDFHGANGMTLFRYRPHPRDPQRSTFDCMDFSRACLDQRTGQERVPHEVLQREKLPQTIAQDADVIERVHRGMRSRGFVAPVFHRFEGRIVAAHRHMDDYLGGTP